MQERKARPRPQSGREIRTVRIELEEMEALLSEWGSQEDKVLY